MRGIDLAELWRTRRWRKLQNLIDHLPRDSAYVEALSEDDELAEQLAGQDDDKPRVPRRMSDWSPVVELLTAVVDRLGELAQITAAAAGAKPGKLAPAPRPVTALERARRRGREQRHRSIVARLLPRPPLTPPDGPSPPD